MEICLSKVGWLHPPSCFLVVLAPLFLLYRVIVRMVGGDPVLGLGSEEYTGPAHIYVPGVN